MHGSTRELLTTKSITMRKIFSLFSAAGLKTLLLLGVVISATSANLMAQDSSATAAPAAKTKSYVKNTFNGNYLIDEQTVIVPVKKTFAFFISHHFCFCLKALIIYLASHCDINYTLIMLR